MEDEYMVDCCNDACGWSGLSTKCLFNHDTYALLCPECNEEVEPVGDKWGGDEYHLGV